jgi:hypothetical protein
VEKLNEDLEQERVSSDSLKSHVAALKEPEQVLKNAPKAAELHPKQKEKDKKKEDLKQSIVSSYSTNEE